MATESQSTESVAWIVHLRGGTVLRIKAETWELNVTGDYYQFSSGGNGCAAMFSRQEVSAILDESAVTATR